VLQQAGAPEQPQALGAGEVSDRDDRAHRDLRRRTSRISASSEAPSAVVTVSHPHPNDGPYVAVSTQVRPSVPPSEGPSCAATSVAVPGPPSSPPSVILSQRIHVAFQSGPDDDVEPLLELPPELW
jgi:hypothetical protein